MGLGVMDARHALNALWAVAHQLWPAADVVLAIGSRMSIPYRGWGTDKNLTIIRIETDAEEMGRIERPTLGIVGDAKANVAALLEVLQAREGAGDRRPSSPSGRTSSSPTSRACCPSSPAG